MGILGNLNAGVKRRAVARSAVAAAVIAFACFAFMLVNGALAPPEKLFPLSAILAAVGAAGAVVVFVFFFINSRVSKRGVALSLDSEHNAKNRLEAAVELDSSDNPMRGVQLADTENFYSGKKVAISLIWPLTGLLLVFALLVLDGYVLVLHYGMTAVVKQIAAVPPRSSHPKKKKAVKETARLQLTLPDGDIQAKPMDDIAWEGVGQSPRPFDKLLLSIYVDGSLKKEIPIPPDAVGKVVDSLAMPEAGGAKADGGDGVFSLKGEFFLDELGVVPFDVVSYHLTGYCELNGKKNTRIISVPKFIEVRPFREDAYILKMAGMNGAGKGVKLIDIIALIEKLIRFQLTLNKALFTLRINGDAVDGKILREQLVLFGKDQRKLEKEVQNLTAGIDPKMVSPNMLNCLKKADDDMLAAAAELKAAVEEWGKTGKTKKRSLKNVGH